MTNRERVLALLRYEPDGLTESEVRERTGIQPHQQVNKSAGASLRPASSNGAPDRRGGSSTWCQLLTR